MKKKLSAIMMATGLTVLTACGSSEVAQPTEVETVENIEEVPDEGSNDIGATQENNTQEESNDIVEEIASDFYEVKVSDWAIEDISVISEKYIASKLNDQYSITNYDSYLQNDNLPDGVDGSGWEEVFTNQQDGSFIINKKNADGTYQTIILTQEFQPVTGNLSAKGKFISYRDDMFLYDMGDELAIFTLDPATNKTKNSTFFKDLVGNIGIANGYVIFNGDGYYSDLGSTCYYVEVAEVIEAILNGTNMPANVVDSIEGEEGKVVEFNNNLPNKDGWLSAQLGEWIVSGDTKSFNSEGGFYNLKENRFVRTPEEVTSCAYYTEADGSTMCTVINDLAVVTVGTDDSGNAIQKIFDIDKERYASDETFLNVELGYGDLILVQNMEGKWGYLRSDSMKHEGIWYDAASDFCNGLSIVFIDGEAHLINDQLQKCSEEIKVDPFKAVDAIAVKDYIDSMNLGGKSVFLIKNDGDQYHLATVEK